MEKGNKGVAGVGAKIAPFVMSINATNNGIVSKISKSTADTKLCKERCIVTEEDAGLLKHTR